MAADLVTDAHAYPPPRCPQIAVDLVRTAATVDIGRCSPRTSTPSSPSTIRPLKVRRSTGSPSPASRIGSTSTGGCARSPSPRHPTRTCCRSVSARRCSAAPTCSCSGRATVTIPKLHEPVHLGHRRRGPRVDAQLEPARQRRLSRRGSMCRLGLTANQSISNASWNTVNWSVANAETVGVGRVALPRPDRSAAAGYYQVTLFAVDGQQYRLPRLATAVQRQARSGCKRRSNRSRRSPCRCGSPGASTSTAPVTTSPARCTKPLAALDLSSVSAVALTWRTSSPSHPTALSGHPPQVPAVSVMPSGGTTMATTAGTTTTADTRCRATRHHQCPGRHQGRPGRHRHRRRRTERRRMCLPPTSPPRL